MGGHKILPRRSQVSHMTPQDAPRRLKDGSTLPKTPENASKTPQDAHGRLQDASRPRFWCPQASTFGGLMQKSNLILHMRGRRNRRSLFRLYICGKYNYEENKLHFRGSIVMRIG